ncbi:Hydroxyacylglutathione hydrolase mitochondrial [Bienertia sinuspersici]
MLNPNIRHKLELQKYDSFVEACNHKNCRQNQEPKGQVFKPTIKVVYNIAPTPPNFNDESKSAKRKEEEIRREMEQKQSRLTSAQKNMMNVVCFKCHRQGHVATYCTSNVLIQRNLYEILDYAQEKRERRNNTLQRIRGIQLKE